MLSAVSMAYDQDHLLAGQRQPAHLNLVVSFIGPLFDFLRDQDYNGAKQFVYDHPDEGKCALAFLAITVTKGLLEQVPTKDIYWLYVAICQMTDYVIDNSEQPHCDLLDFQKSTCTKVREITNDYKAFTNKERQEIHDLFGKIDCNLLCFVGMCVRCLPTQYNAPPDFRQLRF
ncbi:MAG: hypothetical protein COT71_01675 [Candidatus Andersenbacteria bacterium CG10_big_fil_rev_8_21_14_0_10_54_11]|uniref:Uncharacterized protein n=1 Tax=Candidatus Andersenbacteria bacterium CG10_big_fil_rev_8_21_14_0_10_54_11 TaxID=1974485 RepID=A0A2M6WZK1_9BACT|nr:MAG: hypothetical protein COT71_01675 [Candidatus Andersenbacteria bacterium CG10_big_fil_rev_8_21_14_0_10_54_11]